MKNQNQNKNLASDHTRIDRIIIQLSIEENIKDYKEMLEDIDRIKKKSKLSK